MILGIPSTPNGLILLQVRVLQNLATRLEPPAWMIYDPIQSPKSPAKSLVPWMIYLYKH